jgi:hypothetical protein
MIKRQNKGLSPVRSGDVASQDAYRPLPLRYEDYMDWDEVRWPEEPHG